jgi:hypothetical protein
MCIKSVIIINIVIKINKKEIEILFKVNTKKAVK